MQSVVVPESSRALLFPPEGLRERTRAVLFQAVLDGAPAAIVAPRWTGPRAFFEDLALDLALGEERVGCRTVALGQLVRGKAASVVWREVVRMFRDGQDPSWPPVADERGMRLALRHTLDTLPPGERRAYLFCDSGGLPFGLLQEMLGEVTRAWERASVVMAVAEELPWVAETFPVVGRLHDLSFAETSDRFLEAGFALSEAHSWATWTGGVPVFVDAALANARPGDPPSLALLGPAGDELRAAVQIAEARGDTRLDELALTGVLPGSPADGPLVRAGLVREVRGHASLRLDAVSDVLFG